MTEPTPVGNTLRAAASQLEEALNALPEDDWGRRPWHAEEDAHGQATKLAQQILAVAPHGAPEKSPAESEEAR